VETLIASYIMVQKPRFCYCSENHVFQKEYQFKFGTVKGKSLGKSQSGSLEK